MVAYKRACIQCLTRLQEILYTMLDWEPIHTEFHEGGRLQEILRLNAMFDWQMTDANRTS